MFEQVATRIYQLLSTMPAFTSVMEHDGQLHLYPLVGPETASFPLTTYVLGEMTPGTKDINQIAVDILVWFGNEGTDFKACCQFVDAVLANLENERDLYFESSAIDFDVEYLSFNGQIRVKVNCNI